MIVNNPDHHVQALDPQLVGELLLATGGPSALRSREEARANPEGGPRASEQGTSDSQAPQSIASLEEQWSKVSRHQNHQEGS